MAQGRYRRACVSAATLAVAVVPLGVTPPAARAADAAPVAPASATMLCDRASEPGRVRCSIEVRADAGRTISWADAVIVSLPDFATALKGRIGKDDATAREPAQVRWAFGLVARRAGQGEARARVRLVLCDAAQASRCEPVTLEVRAQVSVGG